MSTGRQVISQIRSMSKLLSSDGLINDRTILRECKDAANMIVKQMLNLRKYWNSPNLFAYIPCLEMERVPLSECCDYTSEAFIAKSKKALPTVGEGNYGLCVSGVFSLDTNRKLKESNPNRYSNSLNLGLKTNETYFWIRNNHLYVTNEWTKRVNIYLYPTEDVPNDLLFPGGDCECKPPPSITDLCLNPLDKPFYFIEERMVDLKSIVFKNLMSIYFGLEADKSDNGIDETVRR